MQIENLGDWVDQQKPEIENTLKTLVEINTYTTNTAGVDQGMDTLSQIATAKGMRVETINGRHLLIRVGDGKAKPRILLISHMDTVFPPDGDFLHYEDSGDGFVKGPGTGDIKGGLVMGLWAMSAIQQLCDDVDVQMIVSADEEKGSVSIRDWYLNGHIGADYAIGLEPGFPQGELSATVPLGVVYQRRGYGAIRFTVYGKDAHSGTSELGLNAAEAMAHRILKIQALNDPERGVSANVGTVNGGISANTVPGSVDGLVSFRFFEQAHGDQLLETIQNIIRDRYVYNEGLDLWDRAELTVETFNPPMEKSARNQLLIDIVLEEANRLGQNVVPIARGGGSDANFISAAGTPAICGMGAPAEGIHTAQERIYLPMLFERITLLTSTLYRLIERHQ
jgi:glutamate carboxypeptidase